MSKKSKSYSAYIAEQMCDQSYAQELILGAIEEGDTVQAALIMAIRGMGIKEFSHRSGISTQHVSAFVKGEKTFGYQRTVRCLAVFGLKLTVVREAA